MPAPGNCAAFCLGTACTVCLGRLPRAVAYTVHSPCSFRCAREGARKRGREGARESAQARQGASARARTWDTIPTHQTPHMQRERDRQRERERERETDRQRERKRETDRQTDRGTARQRERERERERAVSGFTVTLGSWTQNSASHALLRTVASFMRKTLSPCAVDRALRAPHARAAAAAAAAADRIIVP